MASRSIPDILAGAKKTLESARESLLPEDRAPAKVVPSAPLTGPVKPVGHEFFHAPYSMAHKMSQAQKEQEDVGKGLAWRKEQQKALGQ